MFGKAFESFPEKEVNNVKNQEEHKGVALVILGVVAVAAIVGLVMMFVQATTTGQVYGGAVKGISYPNWEGRSGASSAWGVDSYAGKRDPTKVTSTVTSCGSGGFTLSSGQVAAYQNNPAYTISQKVDQWGSVLTCVYPRSAMVNSRRA